MGNPYFAVDEWCCTTSGQVRDSDVNSLAKECDVSLVASNSTSIYFDFPGIGQFGVGISNGVVANRVT